MGFTKSLLLFAVDAALDLAIKDWRRSREYTSDWAVLLVGESFKFATKNILFGDAPMDVIDRIELTKPNKTYYLQAKEFVERSGIAGGFQKIQTVFSKSQWTASRYL